MRIRELLISLLLSCFTGLLFVGFGMDHIYATLIGCLFFLGALSLFNYLEHGKFMPLVRRPRKILVLKFPGASRPYKALVLEEMGDFYVARLDYGDEKFKGRKVQIPKNHPDIAEVLTPQSRPE